MAFKELIRISTATDAQIVAGMLENHGIPVMVMNSPFNAVIPPPNVFGGHSLYVPEEDIEEAGKLLEEYGDTNL